jgi:protein-L-isoaspartate(D-aspartate) O-methyltransferase
VWKADLEEKADIVNWNATPDPYAADRANMVEHQLRGRRIHDERVLEVMGRLPREVFVPEPLRDESYADKALPIDCDQTISQPYMVAIMTETLRLSPDCGVLEIGTGSGYQTAVLAALAKSVVTVDRIGELSRSAERTLSGLGIENVRFVIGDGSAGDASGGPYDRILVTAGAPDPPGPLIDQLADGGRLVVPVGPVNSQTLVAVDRTAGKTIETALMPCRFVKLIGQHGWDE